MNYLMDTKNIAKNSYLDSNKFLFTDRPNYTSMGDRTDFSQLLAQAQSAGGVNTSSKFTPSIIQQGTATVVIRPGDTLSNIVRAYFNAQGMNVSSSDANRLAHDLAKSNGIQNPDKIFPGQQLSLSALNNALPSDAGPQQASANYLSARQMALGAGAGVGVGVSLAANQKSLNASRSSNVVSSQARTAILNGDNPILIKTLDRAVEKGYIAPEEKQAVYDKIINMAKTYQFKPDDFARLTLMESDGMNPKATNNRCHGIIQFCDGPDRGAASAGFATNAKEITNRSVLQQLDMVAKYFDETGLKNFGPTSLDDLYLTVLTPAARSETRAHANLYIAGSQASLLHVNRDNSAPITRHSIVEGLHQNAINRLGLDLSSGMSSGLGSSANSSQNVNANQTASLRADSQSLQSTLPLRTPQALSASSLTNPTARSAQFVRAALLAQANALAQSGAGLEGANTNSGNLPNMPLQNLVGMQTSLLQSTQLQSTQLQSTQLQSNQPQIAQQVQLAATNMNNWAQPSLQNAQTSPGSQNLPNSARAQSLRVSAYLSQTYLP